MKKIIYLCSYKHIINNINYDIYYNDVVDIDEKKHLNFIRSDALDIDLSNYDIIIATPPCNYYSRANYRRDVSDYALKTRHLLPAILSKCITLGKPFLVENVRNKPMFSRSGLLDLPCYHFEIGRHTYWTNISFYDCCNILSIKSNIQSVTSSKRQGDAEVHSVIDCFLNYLSFYGCWGGASTPVIPSLEG